MNLAAVHNIDELACPACGARNETGICGMSLHNPLGCQETLVMLKCGGCGVIYVEVGEDGFSHSHGSEYWTRGLFEESEGYEIIGRIKACPDPFNKWCDCLPHRHMDELMYGGFRRAVLGAPAGDRPKADAGRLQPVVDVLEEYFATKPRRMVTLAPRTAAESVGGQLDFLRGRLWWTTPSL